MQSHKQKSTFTWKHDRNVGRVGSKGDSQEAIREESRIGDQMRP